MTRAALPRQVIAYTITDVDENDKHFEAVQTLLQSEGFIQEARTRAFTCRPSFPSGR